MEGTTRGILWGKQSVCVKVDGEFSSGSETGMLDVAMDVYYFYG